LAGGRIIGIAKVELSGGVDPVWNGPIGDRVKIHFQDLALAVGARLRDAYRENGLTNLAVERLVVPEYFLLDQLLCDGAAALRDRTLLQVGAGGAGNRGEIDALVYPETVVLNGNRRVDHDHRHLCQRDAVLGAIVRELIEEHTLVVIDANAVL